ncbi:MAG TPA: NUDIX domain-containing protein [Phenylobacterium sp.]|nr:NUDIX domain-containing protein [Phenylobacterium sp.]
MARPQFGEREAARNYRDRPAAFGLVERDGKIALVRVEKPRHPAWHDLPGGALDPGETAEAAVVREFGEEVGLRVSVGGAFTMADQYFVNTDGEAFNNLASFFTLDLDGEDVGLKIEDDHTLVWMDAYQALAILRHEAHAWAVTAWLRLRERP